MPRDRKSHREEQSKIAVAQLEVVSPKVSLRWRLEQFRLRQIKVTMEYVVGQTSNLSSYHISVTFYCPESGALK